jgi:hypothetical protein
MQWDNDFDDPPLYSKILEGLWQGGTDDGMTTYRGNKRLAAMNDVRAFDSVVSLYPHSLPMGYLIKEFRYAFADGPLDPATIPEIEGIAKWAYSRWKSGERVLIRCQAGMNRSSLITSLVLMRDGKSADEAIEIIKNRRSPYVLSNSYFVEYLNERGLISEEEEI